VRNRVTNGCIRETEKVYARSRAEPALARTRRYQEVQSALTRFGHGGFGGTGTR